MALAALAATLTHYVKDEAFTHIPIWHMISHPLDHLAQTAQSWSDQLQTQGIQTAVIDGLSTVGGGSLPGTAMPTKLLALTNGNPQHQAAALRHRTLPIIGRIQDNQLVFDPRTVMPEQEEQLLLAIQELQ